MTRSTPIKRTLLARKPIASKPAKRWRPSGAGQRFWTTRRAEVLERDGFKCHCPGCAECIAPIGCVGCQCVLNLEVDHVKRLGSRVPRGRYNATHAANAMSNLRVTCRACNRALADGRAR